MAAPKPPKSPPPLSTKIVPTSTSGNPTATLVATASLIVFVRDVLGGALEGAEVTLVDAVGDPLQPPQLSDANGRVVFPGAIKVTTAKAPKPTGPIKVEAPPTVSAHRLIGRMPDEPGYLVMNEELEPTMDGLPVGEVVTGPNVRTLRLGKPFLPKYRYGWQNPLVRTELYPGRKEALRNALNLYWRLITFSVPVDDETQIAALRKHALAVTKVLDDPRPIPTMVNIEGEWFRTDLLPDPPRGKELLEPVRVRRWAAAWEEATNDQRPHERLMKRLLDMFGKHPDLFPDWLRFMIVHFSGMRYMTAHSSYARPSAILGELRRQEYEQQLGLKNTWPQSPFVHKRVASTDLLDELRHEAWRLVTTSPSKAYRDGLADSLATPSHQETTKLQAVLHDFYFDDLRRRAAQLDAERGTELSPGHGYALSLLDHQSRSWPAAARKTVVCQTPLRLLVNSPDWYIDLGGPKMEGWIEHKATIPEAYLNLMERFFWGELPDWKQLGKHHQGKLDAGFPKSSTPWRPDFLRDPEPTFIGTAVCDQICSISLYARGVVSGKPVLGGLVRNAEHYGDGKSLGTQWGHAGAMIPIVGSSFFNAFWQDYGPRNENDYKSVSKATHNVWPVFDKLPGWNYHEEVSTQPGLSDVLRLSRLPKKPPWRKDFLDWEHQGIVLQPLPAANGSVGNTYLSFQTAVDSSTASSNRTGIVTWMPDQNAWVGFKYGESDKPNPALDTHLVRQHLLDPLDL